MCREYRHRRRSFDQKTVATVDELCAENTDVVAEVSDRRSKNICDGAPCVRITVIGQTALTHGAVD